MPEKLLVVINDHIPTTKIIGRILRQLEPYYFIKVVTAREFNLREFLSGEYKLLIIRRCEPYQFSLLKLIRTYKIQYYYYIDDNFWELRGNTPLATTYQNPNLIQTLNDFVSNATLVLTASKNLCSYIKKYNSKTVYLESTFDIDLIKDVAQAPKLEPIKILYSGSFYRNNDFICVVTAIKKILQEYPNKVNFYFYGYIPDELKELNNVIYDENFYNYEIYLKKQYQEAFDIGLAPLGDTPSNRYKACLKYREYSGCKIAGIYTNIPPYSDCVESGKNGLLVEQTIDGWYEGLKRLIDNKALRNNIIDIAHQDILENYSNNIIVPKWRELLDKLPYNTKVKLSWSQLVHYYLETGIFLISSKLKRVYEYYCFHGVKFTSKKIWAYFKGVG